ncbi:hypothetical protein ES702_04066 [subsurface metagenome]
MIEPIKFESVIKINDIPIQWIPIFEFYYPDLPQFPIMYIHTLKNGVRIYGCPVSSSFNIKDDKTCDVGIVFLSNVDLESNSELMHHITQELKERLGITNKVGLEDILECCNVHEEYKIFFTDLWERVSRVYGDHIPYGKFYDEIYSIVRFVSAWWPRTGRQSEMRMLYNFLSIFGERIPFEGKWDYLDLFLLPSYKDVTNRNFVDFPKFNTLFNVMKKIWKIFFVNEKEICEIKIKSMKKAWPVKKDDFIQKVSYPLFEDGKIDIHERESVERLVDAFNRHSWRAAYFIWSIMTVFEKDYYSWDRDFFVNFYVSKAGVGVSEKAVACFLQQGFGKEEITPIDTWVESFYKGALGIESEEEYLGKFRKLGKLERAIWHSCQAKKTNIKTFFDVLWCTRFGDTGNNELRGANPISCYECSLIENCIGYQKIRAQCVFVVDKNFVSIEAIKKGKKITSDSIIKKADENECVFICVTEDGVPKKIFKKRGRIWKLFDEFSGYILTDQKVEAVDIIITVGDLIDSLPLFHN